MTLQQFIGAWDGKFIPSRGGITGQCVSMVQKWAEDNGVTGTPVFPVAAAKDMPGTRKDFFDWIPNTPTGVPQAGDIVVWGNQVGQYGHTAIFIDGNAQSFRSFDQNWPVGTAAHIQQHNYNGVLGWLRFKKPNQGVVMDTADGQWLYQVALRRPAENTGPGSAGQWNGLKPAEAMKRVYGTPEFQALDAKLKGYDALAKQVSELSARPTKAELDSVVTNLKLSQAKVSELEKKVAEEQANRTEDTIMVDEAAKSMNFIKRFLAWLDRRGK
jgi:hypothetical protein